MARRWRSRAVPVVVLVSVLLAGGWQRMEGHEVSAHPATRAPGSAAARTGSTTMAGVVPALASLTQQQKLTAPSGVQTTQFGNAVAMAANDPDIAVVGDYQDRAAYIFTRQGSSWTQQATLTASGTFASGFGGAVAVAVNGNSAVALIGAPDSNAAFVFVRTGTTWSQQTALVGSDTVAFSYFGASVALSADGSTALVSAPGYAVLAVPGAAYVFTRNGSTWTQQAELTAAGPPPCTFGAVAALAADGGTALIGCPGSFVIGDNAYVFTRSGSTWSQQAELYANDAALGDAFGSSVALAVSGTSAVALVGAPFKNRAYVFTRGNTTWTQQAEISAGNAAYGFGASLALSADGGAALLGASGQNSGAGAAFLFTGSGSSWRQQQMLTAGDTAAGDQFGKVVALSGNGTSALLGAPKSGSSTGAAYVFTAGTVSGIAVHAGWTLISLPLAPASTLHAADLLSGLLGATHGHLAALYQLTGGRWTTPRIDQNGAGSGGDFPLAVGVGYLLYSDVAGSYMESGSALAGAPAWSVTTGWSLVGVPAVQTQPQATAVLTALRHATGGHLAALYALSGERWSSPVIDHGGTISGVSFPLLSGQGYLLYSDSVGTVQPTALAPIAGALQRMSERQEAPVLVMTLPRLPEE